MADGEARKGDHVSRWVCFELAGQNYGLPILEVQEVLTEADIEPVPGTSSETLGVINLRGAIVSVIDLRRLLQLPDRAGDANTRIIVLQHAGETLGLRVDRVTQVRALSDSLIKPAPATSAQAAPRQVRGLYSRNGEMLSLLDASILLGG